MKSGVLVLLPVLLICGCGKPSGGVAVVDMDKVATAMGWLNEISKDIQAADAQMRAQLAEVLKRSQQAVETTKTKMASDARLTAEQAKVLMAAKEDRDLAALPLTRQQRDGLLAVVNQANTAWRSALNEYQQAMQKRRMGLVHAYRDKIKPVAMQVAAARGQSVVLTVSDSVLGFEPQNDITDQVADELRRMQPPAPVAAPEPKAAAPAAK
jgi:Skp family chaperone for outer membrane proteins